MAIEPFVLNDQTKRNSYGFRVDNATLDCERFNANSVLLYMHKRGEVHGRWEKLTFTGPHYLGVPVMDVADPESKKIAGKIERGFLKAASLYLNFTEKTRFVEDENGDLLLQYAEVFEASIVDIPSNANSVKLFSDGKELTDEEVKGIMLSASPNSPIVDKITVEDKKQKVKTMEKFKLSAPAIAVLVGASLSAGETEAEINDAIVKLGAALTAEKTAHKLEKEAREKLQRQIDDDKAVQLTALVDAAVTDGKIVATAKDSFIALGYDSAKTIIDGLPAKMQLSGQVNNPQGGANATDPKTMDEFEKLTNEAKLAFKNNNPTGYSALFA